MTHDVIAITPICNDGIGTSQANGNSLTFSQTAVGAAWPSCVAGALAQTDGGTSSNVTRYASRIWVMPIGAAVCVRFGTASSMTASAITADYAIAASTKEFINRPIINGVWATHFSVVAEDGTTPGRFKYGIQQPNTGKDGG